MTSILFCLGFYRYGYTPGFALIIFFFSLLMVISFIDLEHMVIPDALVIFGIFTGIINSLYNGYFEGSMIAISFCFVLLYSISFIAERIFKKEALGEGDIKFSIMLGAFLGIERIVTAIFIASIAGAITGITLILLKRIKREDYIPFGPFLSFGAVMAIFL